MGDVYSTRFAASYAYQGWRYVDIPAGHIAVVKAVSVLSNDAPAASVFGVQLQGTWCFYWSSPGVGQSRHEEVRWTAYGGERLGFYTSHAMISYQVNGFLFAGQLVQLVDAEQLAEDGLEVPIALAVTISR